VQVLWSFSLSYLQNLKANLATWPTTEGKTKKKLPKNISQYSFLVAVQRINSTSQQQKQRKKKKKNNCRSSSLL
jgi:hypothetical protein